MDNKQIKDTLKKIHEDFINKVLYKESTKKLIREKTYFAGGCIRDMHRGRTPKDYDLFFYSDADCLEFLTEASSNFNLKQTKIDNYNSKGAVPIQVITVTSGMPEELVSKFDFTINTGYYCPQLDILKLGDRTSTLEVCHNVLSPLNALIRVQKFLNSGYIINTNTLLELGVAISKMQPLNTDEKIIEALKGISLGNNLSDIRYRDHSIDDNSDTIPF